MIASREDISRPCLISGKGCGQGNGLIHPLRSFCLLAGIFVLFLGGTGCKRIMHPYGEPKEESPISLDQSQSVTYKQELDVNKSPAR